jgi:EAL domain-containing protein (putative c-di-GMP-specific phosphodiesterase class I)
LPDEFLSVAEESGLILPIGDWVLNEACRQLKAWQDKYPSLQSVSVNVNISSKEFAQPNLPGKVEVVLQKSGLSPKNLRLEITEGVLINNYSRAIEVFNELRDKGIQLQIDDFGTGYSALGYLRRFPVDTIKIDKSFIDDIGKSRRGVGIVRAIVAMAHELGMETIAEGIETGEQLSELISLSCAFGQGFLLSKPLDRRSTERILADHNPEG